MKRLKDTAFIRTICNGLHVVMTIVTTVMEYCCFRRCALSAALFLLTAALSPPGAAFLNHQVLSDRNNMETVKYML